MQKYVPVDPPSETLKHRRPGAHVLPGVKGNWPLHRTASNRFVVHGSDEQERIHWASFLHFTPCGICNIKPGSRYLNRRHNNGFSQIIKNKFTHTRLRGSCPLPVGSSSHISLVWRSGFARPTTDEVKSAARRCFDPHIHAVPESKVWNHPIRRSEFYNKYPSFDFWRAVFPGLWENFLSPL